MELDFEHTCIKKLNSHCRSCFPSENKKSQNKRGNYVDVLEFSNFDRTKSASDLNGFSKTPRRKCFADFRYSWSVPLTHDYPSVELEVLSSSRVKRTMEMATKQLSGNSREKENAMKLQLKRAENFFREINAQISKFVCKCCSYVLYKVFRRLMKHLLVCPDEIKLLQSAEKTGIPLVYLPLHRSHLDYLLITWCNWHFGLKLPHIASGDNLNLSGLGWLLRATGAFFIRRRIDPEDNRGTDVLYRSVLHSYIEQVLRKNMPIEFFLEGTRSRFGKVLTPKNGLISNVVEAVQNGFIDDCYLVPVSYTYDAVVEGIFLNELMGVPKTRESVFGVFRGLIDGFKRSQQCGVVRVHYGRPIRLKEYMISITECLSSRSVRPVRMTKLATSYSYRELVPWHRSHSETIDDRSMIRAIGFHVVYEAQMMCSISPVSVFSSLLLARWRQRVSKQRFEEECVWLCQEIVAEGGEVVGFVNGKTSGRAIVDYCSEKMKDCIEVSESSISTIGTHSSFIKMAYNKNSIVCRFSIKAIIAINLLSKSRDISISGIIQDTYFLCDWLQFEFLFCRPCENIGDISRKILSEECWAHPELGLLAFKDENEDNEAAGDFENFSGNLKIRDEKSWQTLQFYANLIRPFVQSLYIVCSFLISEKCPEEPQPLAKVVRLMCKEAMAGNVQLPFEPFLESINSDSFKNALRVLHDKKLLNPNDQEKVSRTASPQIKQLICQLESILDEAYLPSDEKDNDK